MTNLKSISKDIKEFIKPFVKLSKICEGKSSAHELEKAINAIPGESALGSTVSAKKKQLNKLLTELRNTQGDAFNRALSDFIKSLPGGEAREKTSNSWQIKELELKLDRNKCEARFAYLEENLTAPKFIQEKQNLESLRSESINLLVDAEKRFGDKIVEELMLLGFKNAQKKGPDGRDRIPIKELYLEFRLATVEKELGKSASGALGDSAHIPLWVFKHACDRYQRHTGKTKTRERLEWMTGSQIETNSMGILLGGLTQPGKKCFARLSG